MNDNKQNNFPSYIVFVTGDSELFILLDDDDPPCVLGFSTLQHALNYFTGGYNAAHDRGYEGSMSACLNFIQFGPRVARVESMAQLKSLVVGGDTGKVRPIYLHSVSGHYRALRCTEAAKQFYKTAKTPNLITNKSGR